MTLLPKILAKKRASSEVVPKGVSFDGETDYLSRSSDLVGNVDSKTFTLAFSFYKSEGDTGYIFDAGSNNEFEVFLGTNDVSIAGRNTSNTVVFFSRYTFEGNPQNTWVTILLSVDLTSTSKRHMYSSDDNSGTTWITYTNQNIDFSNSNFIIGGRGVSATNKFKGRLYGMFLSRDYIDLSIEANRRIFINADGTANTNYYQDYLNAGFGSVTFSFPMNNASDGHINEAGTGDMTPNGVLATADVGANQLQCKESYFDGVTDQLVLSGAMSASKVLTFRAIFTMDSATTSYDIYTDGLGYNFVRANPAIGYYQVEFANSTNTGTALKFNINEVPVFGRKTEIAFRVDMANTGNRQVFIDGVDVTSSVTWTTYIDILLYTNSADIKIAGTSTMQGSIGELYMDTNLVSDMTAFRDSDNNRPFTAKQAKDTLGSNPLICMALSADNPEDNSEGTGGDFTLFG